MREDAPAAPGPAAEEGTGTVPIVPGSLHPAPAAHLPTGIRAPRALHWGEGLLLSQGSPPAAPRGSDHGIGGSI